MELIDYKDVLEKVQDVVKYVNMLIRDGEYENNWFSYRESINRYKQDDADDTAFIYNDKYMLICIDDKYFFAYCCDKQFYFDVEDSEFNCINQRNSFYLVDLINKMNDYLAHNGYPEHAVKCSDPLLDEPVFLRNIESYALTDKDAKFIKEWERTRLVRLQEIVMFASHVISNQKKVIASVNKKLENEKFQENASDVIKNKQLEIIAHSEEVLKTETERLEKAKELIKQLKKRKN